MAFEMMRCRKFEGPRARFYAAELVNKITHPSLPSSVHAISLSRLWPSKPSTTRMSSTGTSNLAIYSFAQMATLSWATSASLRSSTLRKVNGDRELSSGMSVG